MMWHLWPGNPILNLSFWKGVCRLRVDCNHHRNAEMLNRHFLTFGWLTSHTLLQCGKVLCCLFWEAKVGSCDEHDSGPILTACKWGSCCFYWQCESRSLCLSPTSHPDCWECILAGGSQNFQVVCICSGLQSVCMFASRYFGNLGKESLQGQNKSSVPFTLLGPGGKKSVG